MTQNKNLSGRWEEYTPYVQTFGDRIYMLIRQNLSDHKLEQILMRAATDVFEKAGIILTQREIDELYKLIHNHIRRIKVIIRQYFYPSKETPLKGKVENMKEFEKAITSWIKYKVISGCNARDLFNHMAKLLEMENNPDYMGRKIDDSLNL